MKQIWFDDAKEYRRLYAIEKLKTGKWLFFFDRREVIEWTPSFEVTFEIAVDDVRFFVRHGGGYTIFNEGRGAWPGCVLRRGYAPGEIQRIPVADDEEGQRDQEQRRRKADDAILRMDEKIKATKSKRQKAGKKNGKKGGRPATDGIKEAVADAVKARRANPHLSMKAACQFQIREHNLPVKWQALQKHVKAAEDRKGRV